MRIQNNVSAINAHRFYGINQSNATKSMAKLSSGYRINSAADDAAGLAISEKMRAQIRGLSMASKNTQDAISLIQTAEGGMQKIDDMVQRIRELVNYASNDTQEHNGYSTGDRQKIQDEINQLTQGIDAMAESVEFNKKRLINGEVAGVPASAATLLKGLADAKNNLRTEQTDYSKALKEFNDAATGVQSTKDNAYTILSAPEIETNLNKISALDETLESLVADVIDNIVTVKNALASNKTADDIDTNVISGAFTALAAAADALQGAAVGPEAEAIALSIQNVLGDGNTLADALGKYHSSVGEYEDKNGKLAAALGELNDAKAGLASAQADYNGAAKTGGLYFQTGANSNQGVQLYISSLNTDWLGIGDGHGVSSINVLDSTGSNITAQLDTLDFALSYVTTERSKLGAVQNRLEYTAESLDISTENLTAAESRIRDVDMAKEMTNFTKQSILFQASTAMLAQANAFPQGVLQLLG